MPELIASRPMAWRSLLTPLAAIACLASLGATSRATAECANPRFRIELLTPVADRVPRNAALVAGEFFNMHAPQRPASFQLERRRRSVPLIAETIAPGLFRLTPDARRLYGRYRLPEITGTPELIFGRPTQLAPPVAPRLSRIDRYQVAGGAREVRAHFEFPIPAGVVAIVTFWGDDPAPDVFERAVPTSREVVIYHYPTGRCGSTYPAGTNEPGEATAVRVAFVNQFGQVSPPSNSVPLH